MSFRPTMMSIAGFDPSGGAGILADVKTFEQHRVHGIAVNTAQTLQTEHHFISIHWEAEARILQAVGHLLKAYAVHAVKIGIVQNATILSKIVTAIHALDPNVRIVLDPVIRSTTGFDFWQSEIDRPALYKTLERVSLITPNYSEALQLMPASDAKQSAEKLSRHCSVLVKGGHNEEEPGVDYLYTDGRVERLTPTAPEIFPKHGSGCVLSSAIASNLALGLSLPEACLKAKSFTEKFLLSTPTLIGHHVF